MILGNAVMVLWETSRGREATSHLLNTVAAVVPEVPDRGRILKAIGELLEAQHEASYTAGIAEGATMSAPERSA